MSDREARLLRYMLAKSRCEVMLAVLSKAFEIVRAVDPDRLAKPGDMDLMQREMGIAVAELECAALALARGGDHAVRN